MFELTASNAILRRPLYGANKSLISPISVKKFLRILSLPTADMNTRGNTRQMLTNHVFGTFTSNHLRYSWASSSLSSRFRLYVLDWAGSADLWNTAQPQATYLRGVLNVRHDWLQGVLPVVSPIRTADYGVSHAAIRQLFPLPPSVLWFAAVEWVKWR